MPMTAGGLAKLIEECGELMQVAGKKLAYYHTNDHPDMAGRLDLRMEHEMGDVMAAIELVAGNLGLSMEAVRARARAKLSTFAGWNADPENNQHGVDAARP